ncbi:hypothetical protein A4X03_0g2308, partial [Tilletia caries]
MEMDISWSWFWFEEYIPSNLAGLPTRIATSFAHTTQRIIDSSHTLVASLTQYGPVLPANTASALDFDFDFDFWRSGQPPQPSPAPAPAPTPSTNAAAAAAAGTRQLLLATASTATLIALGITSVLIIPPPRTRLQAHYAGPLWLPYLPGDLHAHITALFSPSSVKTHPTAQQPRTEAVLVLGADTPLGRTIALHLATQGYVVLPVVASSAQAANTWAALTPPSSRGYIAPLLLPTLGSSSSRDEDLSHALAHFRSQLEATLTRRFPLTTAGEPYARPEEQVRLIAVINTLSCFLPSSSSSPTPNPLPSIHTSDTAPKEEDDDDDDTEESNTSTPADSVLLLNQNLTTTDTAVLSDHLHKHVVAPLAAIEAVLPIVRKHASPSKKKKNLTALILNLRAAPHSTTPTSSAHRTEGIIHAALDRALDSLRQECLALDRVERQGASSPHKLKEKKKKSDKRRSAGGEEEQQQQQEEGSRPGVRTYRPGQFDARFFEEEKEEEEEGEAGKKEKQRSKNHRGSSSFHTTVPSVKIVDLQLSDWERVSSSPRGGGGGASSPSASYTNQPPHPFQTRTTPASLLLLPPITDVVRLFGGGGGNPIASAVRNRGARCPQTIRLGLFAPTSSALGTTRVIGDRVVWIQGYLRSGLRALMGVGGGGGGAVFLVGIGTAVGKLWGSVLGLVGLGSVASSRGGRRTVGGGGGRRAGRREREREAGGAGRELVRRRGSPRSEDDDDEGEGYEIVTPTPSRVPGPSGSFHTTAPSTSSSATLGPSHDRSRSNTTTVNYGEMIPPRTAIRPSPFARQQSQSQSQIQQQQQQQQQREQGSSTSTSTPSSSPASSVRGMGGMVLPPAPSAGASPPVLPASHSHAPASTGPGSGSGSGAGVSGSGSGTPLSLSASVLELPSSVPSSSYDGGDGYDSFDEGSGSGLESLPSDFDLGSGVGSRVDVRDEGVEG